MPVEYIHSHVVFYEHRTFCYWPVSAMPLSIWRHLNNDYIQVTRQHLVSECHLIGRRNDDLILSLLVSLTVSYLMLEKRKMFSILDEHSVGAH
jgi:hypothetical protein